MSHSEDLLVDSDMNPDLKDEKTAVRVAKLPDGKSLEQYGQYMKWTYRRWAWEFLRRNVEFQRDCKRVENASENEKSTVARQYGLVKFKHYAEVQTKESGYPSFKLGTIKTWLNETEKNETKEIRLFSGRMLVRFNIVSAATHNNSIKKQIRIAEKKLNDAAIRLRRKLDAKKNSKQFRSTVFMNTLRVLDLGATGITMPKDILGYLYPGSDPKIDDDYENKIKNIKNYKKAANLYPTKDYALISLLKGRPQKV